MYTAYPNGKDGYEVSFHICMGLLFAFTLIVMIAIRLAGPKVYVPDKEMFRSDPTTVVLIVITLLLMGALW